MFQSTTKHTLWSAPIIFVKSIFLAISSSFDVVVYNFNLNFYIGDLTEPVIGSWFTKNFNFQASAYFVCILNIIFAIIFRLYFKSDIKGINKEINSEEKMINILTND